MVSQVLPIRIGAVSQPCIGREGQYQHVGILKLLRAQRDPQFIQRDPLYAQREQVECGSRWVPSCWGSRWACRFHVVCVNFICIGQPTQTRFSVEYGL